MPPSSPSRQRPLGRTAPRFPEVLDVHLAVQLLTVSADTIYDLFQRGDLPGRKVAHHQNGGAQVAGTVHHATDGGRAGRRARVSDRRRGRGRAGGRRADRQSAARDEGLASHAVKNVSRGRPVPRGGGTWHVGRARTHANARVAPRASTRPRWTRSARLRIDKTLVCSTDLVDQHRVC
jgi:hypothetical protein